MLRIPDLIRDSVVGLRERMEQARYYHRDPSKRETLVYDPRLGLTAEHFPEFWVIDGEWETSEACEVICTNNAGMEEKFDVGVSYVSLKSSGSMIQVFDKNGDKGEFFRDRFR